MFKDRGRQQVTTHNCEIRGRRSRLRFFNNTSDARGHPRGFNLDNAVFIGFLAWDDFATDDARALSCIYLRHLREAGLLRINQIIGQMYKKRLAAHRRLRAQHRMTKTQRRRLPDVNTGGIGGKHAMQLFDEIGFALGLEHILELKIRVKVILDRSLGSTGDKYQTPRARGQRLFHGVLDEGLVNHRQHFLGARLGRRQKPRTSAGYGKHCCLNQRTSGHVPLRAQRNGHVKPSP